MARMGRMGSPKPELARRLVAGRVYAGISSTEEMADALGIGRSTVSRWETGKKEPNRYQLMAWADACGLPVEFFTESFTRLAVEPQQPDELRDLLLRCVELQQLLAAHLLPQSGPDIEKLAREVGQQIEADIEDTRQALENDRPSGQVKSA